MEVAGTSRIEGADFTSNELDRALDLNGRLEDLLTKSQRQVRAAAKTYQWVRNLPNDYPVTVDLINQVHRSIVTDCDDEHCEPGQLRRKDQNVSFGVPPHRGCEGGNPCEVAIRGLINAIQHEYRDHDPLIQALSFHYHFAAMHPFLDGNGRTARAIEALLLQRAELREIAFIAMSNYYYDEKATYLKTLSMVRAGDGDLTPFLLFGLRGVTIQCKRILADIRRNMEIVLFKSTMNDLFNRLQSDRKRVITKRQIAILEILLGQQKMDWQDLFRKSITTYSDITNSRGALSRDILGLIELGALTLEQVPNQEKKWTVEIKLDWPARITEGEFFEKIKKMPKAKGALPG
jgi:Fic family protein